MKPIPFEYFAPTTVEEALEHLSNLGYGGKVLAGGQSLIPAMNFRMARPGALVDLNGIPELAYIKPTADGGLAIGTMTRDSKVEHSPEVAKRFPLLPEVMPNIAHPQIRNRGTFGGSIAHADPAGQLPAISIVLNANLKVLKKGSERWVKAEEFFLGPFMTVLEPEEMLAEVVLPALPPRTGSSYQQVSRQKGGYSMAAVASVVTLDEAGKCTNARMVMISVGDVPILSAAALRILVGQKPTPEAIAEVAEIAASQEIDPGTDIHATAEYRRHLIRVLVRRSLTTAFERAAK
ncbi:FAD binding domain-containing protein [Anaerolinea thermophila]|uniref:Carbon monoxide dehydrogenase medium chain n=1 Tax=Anaerolinea thermophila (strain DSM 14523 / JCM 11388 / NBRC 100420 / UNI-1) TaxID=926569 RepID=E8N1J8_ANATU|nr:xanthine dehydrogenase family protein subunit M [Anaerolinea thermophila]BAJ62603.1 carbon monoxide dehydrogenase medium chain [Anaerolinea thermophila UNI-1]